MCRKKAMVNFPGCPLRDLASGSMTTPRKAFFTSLRNSFRSSLTGRKSLRQTQYGGDLHFVLMDVLKTLFY